MPYIHFTDEQKLRANSVDQVRSSSHPAVTSALHPITALPFAAMSGTTMRPRKVEALSLLYRPSMD